MVSEAMQEPRMTGRQERWLDGARLRATLWRILTWLFTIVVLIALYAGWQLREEGLITAEEGVGYWLGIIGGSLMLALLLYPLRKRWAPMRRLGSVPIWFRVHMVFGIVGPVLVLFHSNFGTGSMNSTVALVSMLLVAGSGLVGRYLYGRVHRRLDGRRMTLEELRMESDRTRERLGALLEEAPQVAARLARYEAAALAPGRGLLHSFAQSLWLSVGAPSVYRGLRRQLLQAVGSSAPRNGWDRDQRRRMRRLARRSLASHLIAVRMAADLRFFERLFALWHLLHLPLFIMLVVTGWVHVYAVHVY